MDDGFSGESKLPAVIEITISCVPDPAAQDSAGRHLRSGYLSHFGTQSFDLRNMHPFLLLFLETKAITIGSRMPVN